MTADQGNDRLTIEYYSVKLNMVMAFFFIALGACAILWQYPDTQPLDTGGIVGGALIAACYVLILAFTIFSRPDTATFDRGTGELTVLRRRLLSRKKEVYALSDVIAVLLVTDNRGVRGPDEWPDVYVALKIKGNDTYDRQNNKRLRITSGPEWVKAEKVASFLGLLVDKETIEASPTPTAIDQNQNNKVSP